MDLLPCRWLKTAVTVAQNLREDGSLSPEYTPAERPAFGFRVKDEAAYRRGDNIKEIAFHDQSRNENRSLTISKCNLALMWIVVNSKEGDVGDGFIRPQGGRGKLATPWASQKNQCQLYCY